MRRAQPNSFTQSMAGLKQSLFGSKKIPPYVWILGTAAVAGMVFVAVCMLAALLVVGNIYAPGKILPNITVAGSGVGTVDVGGLSIDEAISKIAALPIDKKIVLRDEMRTWEVSAADLGVSIDAAATANKAAEVGHNEGLGALFSGAQIEPVYTIDLARAGDTLKAMGDTTNVKWTSTSAGRTLNLGATLDTFPPDVQTLLTSGEVRLVMDIQEGPRTEYTVQRGEELALIAKRFNVDINEIVRLNNIEDANLLYPGQTLIIPAAGVWVPTEKDAPIAPLAVGKAIVVSIGNQRIYAYENGRLVHSALMSSGRPGHETVSGDYKIYVKYVKDRMVGPDYDIPDVPWTMYFYKGYGIHGAYWHDNFGRVMSHGCVNLETNEAKWFFDFAQVGTLVRVLPNWTPSQS
jgi:lipoprotein-anchoring transpeptidase ErfK/SrfK